MIPTRQTFSYLRDTILPTNRSNQLKFFDMLPKTSPPRIENCSPKWSKSDNHKWLSVCLFSSKKKGRLLKSAIFPLFFFPWPMPKLFPSVYLPCHHTQKRTLFRTHAQIIQFAKSHYCREGEKGAGCKLKERLYLLYLWSTAKGRIFFRSRWPFCSFKSIFHRFGDKKLDPKNRG